MRAEKVARLRQLMSEALPVANPRETVELAAAKSFELYDFNSLPSPLVEQTPRARMERQINRIANWYGMQIEITRALDAASASCIADLSIPDLESLATHLSQLEDCVRNGFGSPYAPPAQ